MHRSSCPSSYLNIPLLFSPQNAVKLSFPSSLRTLKFSSLKLHCVFNCSLHSSSYKVHEHWNNVIWIRPFLSAPTAAPSRVLTSSHHSYWDSFRADVSASGFFWADPTYSQTCQWFSSSFIFFRSFACPAISGDLVSLIYAQPKPSLPSGLSTNITAPRIPAHLHFSLSLTAACPL